MLAGISVGWKLVVLTLGIAVPRWVIGDGIAHLPLPQQAYALQAKAMALPLWNHPLERFGLVRALRVISVDSSVDSSVGVDSSALAARADATPRPRPGRRSIAAAPCVGVGATVRAYTYFAIPYSEARLGCGTGVVEYRVFRRRP